MAEQTVALKSDASTTVATLLVDQVGSNVIGCSKIIVGADDTNDGFVSSANPLPVSGTVTVSGVATAANQTSELALLTTIDTDTGGIATSAASIDTKTPALGQALAAASVPVVLTEAQVTTLTPLATVAATQSGTWTVDLGATDNAVLDAIAASVAGTLTVGSHAVTNAGTFLVQAEQSGTWNVTNISGTVSLPTGASTAAKQPALGTAGTASADVITVQGIASMTALVVDGSGVTQPVSAASLPLPTGAATAANQTTIIGHVDGLEGLLTTIDADTGTIAGAVIGSEMQVDVVAALPAGTNNIGDVDIASIAAGDNNIGNVDLASAIPAGTNLIGRVSASLETNTIYDGTTALTPKFAAIAASSSGNNTIVAAVTSKKIRVLAYNLIGNGAVNAKFQTGAGGTDLTGLKYIAAAGGGICAPYCSVGWFETASGALLNLNLSGAVAVGGEIVYVEV